MEGGAIVAIVFGGLIVLALWFYLVGSIAKEFRSIAQKKGHYDERYFWWTFWLGVVGMLMVIALPDVSGTGKNNHSKAYQITSDDLPDL